MHSLPKKTIFRFSLTFFSRFTQKIYVFPGIMSDQISCILRAIVSDLSLMNGSERYLIFSSGFVILSNAVYLFIKFIVKREYRFLKTVSKQKFKMFPRQTVEGPVIFRDAFSNVFCTNVFIFFIYFLILFLKKFFLIISIVSSMGTFVKRDSTSIEIIKSSLSILILLNLLIKSKESLRVYLNFLF